MSLKPLFPLTEQFHGIGGENLVAGLLKVYMSDTDDTAETYSDATGETLNPCPIVLDNLGMAQVWVDSEKVYRLEVYDRSGALLYTRYPMYPMDDGDAESAEIISTDGSIAIDKTHIGSSTQYDLSVAKDSAEYLEWAHCSECRTPTSNTFFPIGDEGSSIFSDNTGLVLTANGLYHISFKLLATKSAVAPYYDGVSVKVNTSDGTETITQLSYGAVVDGSLGLSQEFDISGDIRTGDVETTRIFVTVEDTSVAGVTYSLASFDIHRVFSGTPHIPGLGLVAGTGISLTKSGNTLTIASSGSAVYKVLREAPDSTEIAQIVADANALQGRGAELVLGIYNSYSGKIMWYRQTLTQPTGAATGTVGFSCCFAEYSAGSWGHVFYTATFYADADAARNYSRFMAGFGNNVHVFDPWMNFGS